MRALVAIAVVAAACHGEAAAPPPSPAPSPSCEIRVVATGEGRGYVGCLNSPATTAAPSVKTPAKPPDRKGEEGKGHGHDKGDGGDD